MELPLPYHASHGFDGLIGLVLTTLTDEEVRGELTLTDAHKQPFGVVHGGVFASIAESLASFGTAFAVMAEDQVAMGLSNQTSFLRPMRSGVVRSHARRRHRGRMTWVWEVDHLDDTDRLCAITRMTIAVRAATGDDTGGGAGFTEGRAETERSD